MKYYFIVNPGSRSGHGKAVWEAVEEILKKEQVEYQAFYTSYRYHATELARELSSQNEKIVLVALGGDGTVNEVLNGIQDFSKVTFAYIPTGSSNDYARSLGLPAEPEDAVHNILNPKYLRKVDIGVAKLNGKTHRFAGSSGCGFDAAVCHEALASRFKNFLNKIKLGKLTYVGIALKQIMVCKRFNATMVLDDNRTFHFKNTFFIAGMNCSYEGGGLWVCPDAKPDDGILDFCIVENLPRFILACILPTAYLGKHGIFPGVHILSAREMTLSFQGKVPFHTDGEPDYVQNQLNLSCLPKYLTLIAGK